MFTIFSPSCHLITLTVLSSLIAYDSMFRLFTLNDSVAYDDGSLMIMKARHGSKALQQFIDNIQRVTHQAKCREQVQFLQTGIILTSVDEVHSRKSLTLNEYSNWVSSEHIHYLVPTRADYLITHFYGYEIACCLSVRLWRWGMFFTRFGILGK